MLETVLEYIDSRGVTMRVDRELGVLRGVKILGLESRNGRTYLPEALSGAIALYEGAKVNVNHPKGSPVAPRDYQDRIGVVRHIKLREGEGLFGDLFFNPQHTLAGQLAWDAEHAPENVGFSHNVQAKLSRRGDQVVVEAITRVQSVDLVADPATTRGLFESAAAAALESWATLTIDRLKTERPDLVEAVLAEVQAEVDQLHKEIDSYEACEAARQRQALVGRLLAEYELPAIDSQDPLARTVVSPRFVESLLAAKDEAHVRQLVEERSQLVNGARSWPDKHASAHSKPMSRDQHLTETVIPSHHDAAAFVRAIT